MCNDCTGRYSDFMDLLELRCDCICHKNDEVNSNKEVEKGDQTEQVASSNPSATKTVQQHNIARIRSNGVATSNTNMTIDTTTTRSRKGLYYD
jgi:hypothetical protein